MAGTWARRDGVGMAALLAEAGVCIAVCKELPHRCLTAVTRVVDRTRVDRALSIQGAVNVVRDYSNLNCAV